MSLFRKIATLFATLALLAFAAPAQAQTKVRIGKPQAGAFQFVPVDLGIEVGIFKNTDSMWSPPTSVAALASSRR